MLRITTFLLVLAGMAITSPVQAQTEDAGVRADDGFRVHATVGYPSLMAMGLGWKLRSGTELMLQGGGVALWAFVAGTAEASLAQDILRRRWGAIHVAAAGSVLHTRAFVIDCYEGETCEDQVQTLWLGSPRLGLRLTLDRNKRRGVLPYLELNAGPQVGRCAQRCPNGDFVINAAFNIRGVLDWAADRGH